MLRAMILDTETVDLVAKGSKRLILKGKNYSQDVLNKDFILFGRSRRQEESYSPGSIYVYKVFEIPSRMFFNEMKPLHLMSDEDRVKYFGNTFPLYGYAFRFVPFSEKILVKIPKENHEFIVDVKFDSRPFASLEMIENVSTYDPRKLSSVVLLDDWRIVLGWFSSLKEKDTKERSKHSAETIENLALIILRELIKRGVNLKREEQPEDGLDLFDRTLERIRKKHLFSQYWLDMDEYATVERGGLTKGLDKISMDEVLQQLKPFKLRKPIAFLVGGIVTHGHTEGDIDVLIRSAKPNLPLEFRIYRQFPKEWWNRFHFIYDSEHRGPFTDYVPLYDLDASLSSLQKEQMHDIEDFIQYPVMFIGSKRRIVEDILEFTPKNIKSVVDIFAGSGVVGYFFKRAGMKVVTNEIYQYMRNIHGAFIANQSTLLSDEDISSLMNAPDYAGYVSTENKRVFYDPPTQRYVDGYIKVANEMGGFKKYIALGALVSALFSFGSGRGHARFNIDRMRRIGRLKENESCKGKLKEWIKKRIGHFHEMVFQGEQCASFNEDGLKLIEKIPGSSESMAFIDPPYVTGKNTGVLYYDDINLIEEIVVQQKIPKRQELDWNRQNWWEKMNHVLDNVKGHEYIMLTYVSNPFCSPRKITKALRKRKRYVRIKVIPLKHTFHTVRKKKHQEIIFLASDNNLDNTEFLKPSKELFKTFTVMENDEFREYHAKQHPMLDLDEYEEFSDPFLDYPDIKNPRFVLQIHVRGRSVHLDNRRQITKDLLVGMTHDVEKGLSREPESLNDAKELYEKEIAPLVKKHFNNPRMKLLSQRKSSLHPAEWLDIEGEIEPGDTGATKHKPAFMWAIDSGQVEFLTMKPHFHEYLFHGKILDGKYIDRKLENIPKWKKTGGGKHVWMFFKTENPPYVITQRAVKEGWMPPHGESALPRTIESSVPKTHRYWLESDSKKARLIRKSLIKELKNRGMKFQDDFQTFPSIGSPSTGIFSMTHQKFKSYESDYEMWNINVVFGSEMYSWHCYGNQMLDETTAVLQKYPVDEIKTLGRVKPQQPLNPTKASVFIDLVDKGECVMADNQTRFVKLRLHGSSMKGVLMLKQERDANIWNVYKSDFPHSEFMAFGYNQDFEIQESPKTDTKTGLPEFLEISGLLFTEGVHKNRRYSKDVVSSAKLEPSLRGTSLAYVNFFHNREEFSKVGIMTKIWWDASHKFECKKHGRMMTGGLMFHSIVTDPDGIRAILERGIYQVSAELAFDTDKNDVDVEKMFVSGMAICFSPALPNAQILKACDGQSCKTFPTE
jgi:adenine-specific DNA methylase